MTSRYATAACGCAMAALAACSVGPAYKRPQIAVPEKWHDPIAHEDSAVWPTPDWWHAFGSQKLDELIADKAKAKAWQKKFEDKGIRVMTLSCHGNAVHPDKAHAAKDAESFRKTVQLAQILDVKTIVTDLGVPAVLVTHHRQDARVVGDRIVRLDRGRVAASGAVEEHLLAEDAD